MLRVFLPVPSSFHIPLKTKQVSVVLSVQGSETIRKLDLN